VKPRHTDESRAASFARLVQSVRASRDDSLQDMPHRLARLNNFVHAGDIDRAGSVLATLTKNEAYMLAHDVLTLGWCDKTLTSLGKILSSTQLLAHIYQACAYPFSDADQYTVDNALSALDLMHWSCFALAGLGKWKPATRLAQHLRRFHDGGDITFPDESSDKSYRDLLHFLVICIADESWPEHHLFQIGPYKALIDAAHDPAGWQIALVEVADFKMARTMGYPDADGSKPTALSERALYFMEQAYAAAWSAELWAIQALAQRHHGVHPCLQNMAHPWLSHAFNVQPGGVPENELSEAAQLVDSLAATTLHNWSALPNSS
jgi:hypothetical protein